ncbi:hypothetical protein D8Y22_10370 [Salinadaptatus halalkaliphilus]|uniref:Uncharacterized protein n=1 Tax=Salinadaptatus halalkaliphilus TaxID=2419781 RepID=A0A4S3TP52_9EURY|nr:hypothetical protein [Salinadaptatus halalkaliphilus]THE65003.1 hypothetical protein D8Y22_10370 [Salinadaptatus halalkaliphilus]
MPSSSRSISRRRILAATGAGLGVAIAGCTGDDRSSSAADDAHATHEASEGGPPRASTHEYESLQVRADDAERFVYQDDDAAPDPDADEDTPSFRRSIVFVTDTDEADALWIDAADSVEAELRSFVDDTDFGTQTVAIDQRGIDDCYRRQLLRVQAENDQFRTAYCQQLKDPEAACVADRRLMEAVVIRVERVYDETPSGRGSSESMSCRGPIVHGENGLEDDAATGNASSTESTTNSTSASNVTAEGDDR